MKILENNNKHLIAVLPKIVFEKLNKETKSLKYIGGGSFGKVFKAELSNGEVIALKSYRVLGSQDTEAYQLNVLSQNTDVAMPKVLFTYEDENIAILAMSFIKGKNVLNPCYLFKSKQQKKDFSQSVISGMLQWHSLIGEKFGYLDNPTYDTWFDFYKKEKQEPWLKALQELCNNGKFSKNKMKLLLEATEIFNSLPHEDTLPVLIHGDLNIMNMMADEKTFVLTAFIDPCGSMWAEREYDLFQLRNMWGDAYSLYETYKANYNLSKYADFKVAYYASMNEAAMRLSGGLIMPLWEDLNNKRLKKEIQLLKEKMR